MQRSSKILRIPYGDTRRSIHNDQLVIDKSFKALLTIDCTRAAMRSVNHLLMRELYQSTKVTTDATIVVTAIWQYLLATRDLHVQLKSSRSTKHSSTTSTSAYPQMPYQKSTSVSMCSDTYSYSHYGGRKQ